MYKSTHLLGIPKREVHLLRTKGYTACEDINENLEILNQLGINRDNWKEKNEAPETKTAAQLLLEEEESEFCIITFNIQLDKVLKNQITCGRITELCGLPGTGKTQLCLQLSISIQVPKCCGGSQAESVFIDTNGNFAVQRLKEISMEFVNKHKATCHDRDAYQEHEFTADSILQRIHYIEADDYLKILACIKHLETSLENTNVKLIIVDSISWIVRQISFADRVARSYVLLRKLLNLARSLNLAVVLTNDMTTKVDGNRVYNTPSFGESFYHAVNSRIMLSKDSSGSFNAAIVKGLVDCQNNVDFNF